MFGHSRQKKKNPTKRVYNERTIELGILVDYYLWDSMKVNIYLYFNRINHKFILLLYEQKYFSDVLSNDCSINHQRNICHTEI
jgi:hypothetical protein